MDLFVPRTGFSSVTVEKRCYKLRNLLGEIFWAQVHYMSFLFPGNFCSFFPESITSICEDTKSNHRALPENQVYINDVHSWAQSGF